jgi:translation elongation factor EF-Tu-like GTPase
MAAVSKSVLGILAIGVAGALLLSMMMKQVAELHVERQRSPFAAAVDSRLGAKLVGRVVIDEVEEGDRKIRVLRATVIAGFNKRKLADAAGMELWLGSMRAGDPADEVRVVLRDDEAPEQLETFVVAPPRARR